METTQGISGLLQLMSTWSVLPKSALFLGPHGKSLPEGVLPKLITCLSIEKTKDEVKIFVLGILQSLVKLALAPANESEFNEVIKDELLDPNAEAMLVNISTVVKTTTISNDLLEASLSKHCCRYHGHWMKISGLSSSFSSGAA